MKKLISALALVVALLPAVAMAESRCFEKKVVILSTPTCPYCIAAKAWFRENNVEMIDYDVQRTEKGHYFFSILQQSHHVRGVPVILFFEGDKPVSFVEGFRPEILAKAFCM